MRPLPSTPVFTSADLASLEWTRSSVRNAVRVGRLTRVRHGVYCAGAPSSLTSVLAAACAYPRATVSHRSALRLHDLPLLGRHSQPELTVPPRASVTMPGVYAYRATIPPSRRTTAHGAGATTVARSLVDVARDVGIDAGVVAMDAALHRRLVTLADLEDVLNECQRWPGIRNALQALRLADGRSESPLESVSRLAFPRLGLPAPQPQVDVFDVNGVFLGRADFGWDELGVIGESDGRQKYRDPRDPDALVREKDRQEAIERTGLVVARWGWDEAWRRQPLLRNRVLSAFARARAHERAGLPRTWELRPAR